MPSARCPRNSRSLFPVEIDARGRVRAKIKGAIQVFEERTGTAHDDANNKILVGVVLHALTEEARGSGDQPRARRGRPKMSDKLRNALTALTKALGPSNAALLLLIYGADASKVFPTAIAAGTKGWDIRVLHRRTAKNLSRIAGRN